MQNAVEQLTICDRVSNGDLVTTGYINSVLDTLLKEDPAMAGQIVADTGSFGRQRKQTTSGHLLEHKEAHCWSLAPLVAEVSAVQKTARHSSVLKL